ncbi:MAG: hypothetical protein HOV94_03875, partial [Saccharothrix sp.]|nr:hypothetical protein [Saccharothrix sp.]
MRRSVLVGALAVVLGACSAGPVPAPPPPSDSGPPPVERVYVSLGDSYATGYRPVDTGTNRDGFAYLVAERSGLRLVNVACSGATSAQLRAEPGCAPVNRGPDAPDPAGRTQLDAAVRTLRENQGRVGLVTVVIGRSEEHT